MKIPTLCTEINSISQLYRNSFTQFFKLYPIIIFLYQEISKIFVYKFRNLYFIISIYTIKEEKNHLHIINLKAFDY